VRLRCQHRPHYNNPRPPRLLSLLSLNQHVDTTDGKPSSTLKIATASGPPVWKILVLESADEGYPRNSFTSSRSKGRWGYFARVRTIPFPLSRRVVEQRSTLQPTPFPTPSTSRCSRCVLRFASLSNIRRIAEDLEKSLYESFHLNFVEPLPRALLEELAASVAKHDTDELVEQVLCPRPLFIRCLTHFIRLLTSTCPSSHLHLLYSLFCRCLLQPKLNLHN
jgi:hypothetical protein